MGQELEGLHSIGALARASGLSVSALRFYDAAGILRPAEVDATSGYRWYTTAQVTTARLIASLRRVSMPLTDINAVLAARHRPDEATRLLEEHLGRLEAGLLDARHQLDLARRLLAPALVTTEENPMTTMTVRATDLAAAFAAVRYAMSTDPELPALNGVLLDFDATTLRLAATDRFRLAVAGVATREPSGPACRVVAPVALIDALLQDSARTEATVAVELTESTVTIGDRTADGIDAAFPDYQQLLRNAPVESVRVRAENLVELVTAGPTRTLVQNPNNAPHEISALVVDGDTGTIEVTTDHPDAVGFNREFLLQALEAAGAEELVLALDGPIRPLAMWAPGRPDDMSLLMPTALG
ncbi:MAG: MerR family transcriptional regulator [Mycobacteriaceae bacterium]